MANNTTVAPQQEDSTQHDAVVVRTGGATASDTLRNIRLIIGREYLNRVRQRSFIISTVLLLILILAATCVPTVIAYFSAQAGNAQTKIAVLNGAGSIGGLQGDSLTQYVSHDLNGATGAGSTTASSDQSYVISTQAVDTLTEQQAALKNGKLDIVLLIERKADQTLRFTYYTNTASTDTNGLSAVQALAGQLNVLDRASHLGLTPAQTNSLFTQPDFNVVSTQRNQGQQSESDRLVDYFVGYAGVLLIFMSVYLYGLTVATGVAEEKGTRIMEILVNAATPFQLLCGKIVGIGAAGLTQMALLVAVGVGGLLAQTPLENALLGTHNPGFSLNFTQVSIVLLLLVLVYFVLGFLLYATLFAAAGAIVKRQDEVQNAAQPITWLFMIGYLVSLIAGSSSNATWFKVFSLIPFWTPTTMVMRVGQGTAETWEILLSIGLMIVAILICAYISARIYRYGVLMYGQKPGLGQLIKVVRSKR